MPAALKLIVTDAGRAVLANAKKDGTLPIQLASVGVTASDFVADAKTTQLPGEIKRLATLAGGATAADTLHVTLRDSSTDTYSVRGLALYLQDGTLFGSYGQSAVAVEKSAQATMLLAMDVQFADIAATDLVFGDTNFQLNQATAEQVGVVELATDSETTAGADAQRAVTPKGLLAALNARLGLGAPSEFIKGLLTAANAAVLRAALAIKSAALKDEGDGNGLDADLLDGQHGGYYRAWANLTGVPGSFPPSGHAHSAADITAGTLPVVRGGTGVASLQAGYFLVGAATGTDPMVPKSPGDVLASIGAAAKVHSHAIGEVNGLQGALDAKAPLASPTFSGRSTFPSSGGAFWIAAGTGDNATYATHNVRIHAHWGIGIEDYAGTVNGFYDARLGQWDTKRVPRVNGVDCWYPGNFDPASKANLYGPFMVGDSIGRSPNNLAPNSFGKSVRFDFVSGFGGSRYNGILSFSPWLGDTVSTGDAAYQLSFGGTAPDAAGVPELQIRKGVDAAWGGWHRLWHSGIFNPATKADLAGAAFTGNVSASGNITTVGGALRAQGWGGIATDGVVYFGATDSYIYKSGGSFSFRNEQGGYNAVLSSGGTIWTSGNVTPLDRNTGGTVNGTITATGGFQYSDRRLKQDIAPRAVQRGLALKLAGLFSEWRWRATGERDVGLIAQRVRRVAAHYVRRTPDRRCTLAIDKAGLALEAALDNALHLREHDTTLRALLRRLETLENRHAR